MKKSYLEQLQEMTDAQLAAQLEDKQWSEEWRRMVLHELGVRALKRQMHESFTPRWVGWAVLILSALAVALGLVQLLKD